MKYLALIAFCLLSNNALAADPVVAMKMAQCKTSEYNLDVYFSLVNQDDAFVTVATGDNSMLMASTSTSIENDVITIQLPPTFVDTKPSTLTFPVKGGEGKWIENGETTLLSCTVTRR